MTPPLKPRARSGEIACGLRRDRGFVLIIVVGMLSVLVVLGLSYAEQGWIELRGASNSHDLETVDWLAEVGFQFSLRALQDDRNVKHPGDIPAHLSALGGSGWTSRWGYNPDPTMRGALPTGADAAPSRANAYNYQDSWRMLFWNEETVEPVATWTGKAWGYGFKFRPGNDDQAKRSMETQRYPQPGAVLLDTVQLQPFARVRKFRVKVGSSFGLIQIGISPKDGGLNLNDLFAPGTILENPGVYETLPQGNTEGTYGFGAPYEVKANDPRVPLASPDRRTLEYMLGKVPQFANKNREAGYYYRNQPVSFRLALAGSSDHDNGIYNWRHYFEPYGGMRAYSNAGGPSALWKHETPSSDKLRASTGIMTSATSGAPTTIWNVAGGDEPNRYGMENSRHVMWTGLKGMAYTADGWYGYPGIGFLVDPNHYGSAEGRDYLWFPSGLWRTDPRLPARNVEFDPNNTVGADHLFQGFGFDRFNPHRAGIEALSSDIYWNGFYIGAGAYGHPKARTFQVHFINAVAQGRFWTDLLAAWYFGGAPGYTNYLGAAQGSSYNNWAHLGSSYDSLGIGTHWMPPTSHVWLPGFFSKGRISTPTTYQTRGGSYISGLAGKDEVSRGMTHWPGNMPPVRMAASYLVPMARWPADFIGQSNAHFSFNNFRLSIRAHGIQENWGDPLNPGTINANGAQNRWYDAVDVNNTNFPVVYGILTPEKIPSLMNRTSVAPHLHWKARMLDVECRLKRPVKIDGSAEPYDDVKNSWIPVQIGLRTPDATKTYPGGGWDGDPDSGSYNPWIPLRMKLENPGKPWNPDSTSGDYNIWVEPKLLHPGQPYDPMTNPFYNSAVFLDELKNDANMQHDFIKYPWMPSLKDPVVTIGGVDLIKYGMYGWNDPAERPNMIAKGPGWSAYVQDSLGAEKFPYMPIEEYRTASPWPSWEGPGPFDGATPYPSPGWAGYLFEPRWYTGRTVNPKYLKNKRDDGDLADIDEYYAKPGHDAGGGVNTLHASEAPANFYDFSSNTNLEGGIGALTGHRHVDPDRPNVVWGKMDFLTPEPEAYYDLNGDVLGYGTGRPTDDVFTDTHTDLSLQDIELVDPRNQEFSSAMARPDSVLNWHDWFNQRKRTIPADPAGADKTIPDVYRPNDNTAGNTLYPFRPISYKPVTYASDGKTYSNVDFSGNVQGDPEYTSPPAPVASSTRRVVRGATICHKYWRESIGAPEPDVKPHSIFGLPNPDYLLLYPGFEVSQHWADQFRRYFPLQTKEIDTPGNPYDDPDDNPGSMGNNPYPGAMSTVAKLVDAVDLAAVPTAHTAINPAMPAPKTLPSRSDTPVVPAVCKDEAWRITRIGPRYQEIIANEIMDYQINPWWPNPCVPVSELCVPLDKQTYPSEPRAKVKVAAVTGRNRWRSYVEHMTGNEDTIGARVPKDYAYFNRFWARTNHKAVRNWTGSPNDPTRPLGEPYRAITVLGSVAAGVPDELINATEGKGMYPPTWQYFGQYPPAESTFHDRIKDFPYNVMEDQLGDDWRYLAKAVVLMTEPQMQKASGRNHPFRNWADFVAFLGHLVYRSPMSPKATPELAAANPKAVRDPLNGVDAYEVCHGANADPRNLREFFDGSRIRVGAAGMVYADSLHSTIVAKEGFWPISANYGRAPDAGADPYYPEVPANGGWNAAEWKRRWDEMRGRDEAGLRIEHHYISERAANDVLVSVSNGMIGPIDFDGDGHVVMTRGYGKAISSGSSYSGVPGSINEFANAKPSGDLIQQRLWDGHSSSPHHWPQWSLPYGYPWHALGGNDVTVEYEEYDDEPAFNGAFANRNFWDTDANPLTMAPLNLKLGVRPKPDPRLWRKVEKEKVIQNCVTLPIKFRSNTFRVTVVVELCDAECNATYVVKRYQKIFSRVPDAGTLGTYTDEFVEQSSRACGRVDPELSWMGVP